MERTIGSTRSWQSCPSSAVTVLVPTLMTIRRESFSRFSRFSSVLLCSRTGYLAIVPNSRGMSARYASNDVFRSFGISSASVDFDERNGKKSELGL